MKRIPVAVVGAGPAGLAASTELARLGHEVHCYERESVAGGMPRHCGHQGFGLLDLHRSLDGPAYAAELVRRARRAGVTLHTDHTLLSLDGKRMRFCSPEQGAFEIEADRILLALGARETPRPARLIDGIRSPAILTTGALQRFVTLQGRRPFRRAVVIGSDIVGFSAIMTCRHAGIEAAALLEEGPFLRVPFLLARGEEMLLGTHVYAGCDALSIEGERGRVEGVRFRWKGEERFIKCDGIILSGEFTPESALLRQSHLSWDSRNDSLPVTQGFGIPHPGIYAAGNLLRGALAAYKCHAEGIAAARSLHTGINRPPAEAIPIATPTLENLDWISPSLVDPTLPHPYLTRLRFRRPTRGTLLTLLNGREVMRSRINARPWQTVTLPWFGQEVKEGDLLELRFL